MKQSLDRRVILTSLAVAAVLVLQNPSVFADDPPTVDAVTYGCSWTVVCGDKTGSDTVHGALDPQTAVSQAMMAAMQWRAQNCGTSSAQHSMGTPFEERTVAPPVVEQKDAKAERVTSPDKWIVMYKCRARNGDSIEIPWEGSTFCEAYSTARKLVCQFISNEPFNGACCCCYRIVQRPCCQCSSCCR
jgi:hypothetical protein